MEAVHFNTLIVPFGVEVFAQERPVGTVGTIRRGELVAELPTNCGV